jgi:hypothetical protein
LVLTPCGLDWPWPSVSCCFGKYTYNVYSCFKFTWYWD